MKKISPNRISIARHNQVTSMGVCPNCWNFRIVSAMHVITDKETGKKRFSGSYLCCGSEKGHLCWHMTKNPLEPHLYEVFGKVDE